MTVSGTGDLGRLPPGSLAIEQIETFAVRVPLGRPYVGSNYSMDSRCTIVTRLRTADGILAEVYNGDTDAEQARIVDIIHDELAPRVLGRSAADPEGCWRAMEPATNDILRDRGLALQAIACLDTAIWDAFGRALGLPLHRVWGACTEALPVSIIGGYYHLDREELADFVARYAERGVAAAKIKVGGRSAAEDAARVRAVRDATPPDLEIMVDANQGYDRMTAVEFARLITPLGIRWFEEPCRWTNDRRWMRDVRLQTGIPVAGGQSEVTLAGLRDLILDAAIDVSNFDASWAGGPTIWRKAAGLAAAFGVEVAHHEEPQIAAHLLASQPHATYIECFDEERDPLFWRLRSQPVSIRDGRYLLPDGPGFGIELNWDYVRAHTVGTRTSRR